MWECPWFGTDHLQNKKSAHHPSTPSHDISKIDEAGKLNSSTNLSLAVRPKVRYQANEIVNARVRRLVHYERREREERVHHQPRLDRAVKGTALEEAKRPLKRNGEDAKHEVQQLQHRYRLDGRVEVAGGKVPEDFGPEEAFNGGSNLVCEGRMDVSLLSSFPPFSFFLLCKEG